MILLDPKLEPDPATASAARSSRLVRDPHRIPSTRTLALFLKAAHTAVRLRGKVSVFLTTDKEIRRLNRDFRGIDKATDVLSFPAAGAITGIAGDLAISVPTARRQAVEQGHSLAIEIKVLLLHGLLHLAGFDHERDDGRMARREQALRAKLGLPQGLIERSTSGAKAPLKKSGHLYGLKPVPFAPKFAPFAASRKSFAGATAHNGKADISARLKPSPDANLRPAGTKAAPSNRSRRP